MSAAAPPRPPQWPKDPPPRVVASPRIERLAADLAGDPGVLARFWEEVEATATPLVESAPEEDERIVTFLWRESGDGRRPSEDGAEAVILMANKLTDPSVLAESALERLGETDVWHRSYLVRADWRGTYQLAVDRGGERLDAAAGPLSRWRGLIATAAPDPLNPHRFPAKDGGAELSLAELPAAPPAPPLESPATASRGTVLAAAVASTALGEPRDVWVREPAGDAEPAGLLVLLDGEDWRGRLAAPAILDALEAGGQLAPLLTVMVGAGDRERRWRELACDPGFEEFLSTELTRWARQRGVPAGGPSVIAGQSLGGLTALNVSLRRPGSFDGILAQSSSLWWAPDGDDETGWIVDELEAARPTGVRFRLEVGRQEWVLLELHRRLRGVLAAAGSLAGYVEYEGGHDAVCWRAGLAAALPGLVPPAAS